MAYGAYLSRGRPQAVMTHANVGAANAVIGLIAAARMNIPLIFIAGKTSHSERETLGHRDKLIHGAQGAMYREYVKWEAEVHDPGSLCALLDRAYAIAMTEPRGPVALLLSRDVLLSEAEPTAEIQLRPARSPGINSNYLTDILRPLNSAKRPLLITNRAGADPAVVTLLTEAAERHGFGVLTPDDFYMSFPPAHAQHLGFRNDRALRETDFVLVLDTEVPWYPLANGPQALTVHVSADPLVQNIPLRSHRGDVFCGPRPLNFSAHSVRWNPQKPPPAKSGVHRSSLIFRSHPLMS